MLYYSIVNKFLYGQTALSHCISGFVALSTTDLSYLIKFHEIFRKDKVGNFPVEGAV
jgi:hypothetical protein